MAVLADPDRAIVWRDFMAERSAAKDVFGALTKAELRAAVNALDQWVSDNGAAINSAIPQPARAVLTTQQKALLMQFVISKRYLSGV